MHPTEETTVFRIAGQNLVHDPEGRPLTNQPLLQLVICVWPSGATLQHHRPSRKSHRAASSCIGHRNRHWIVSFGDKRHRGVSMAIVPSYLAISDLIAGPNTMAA